MALSVALSGPSSIEQGAAATFTATVTDSDSNPVVGAVVDFSAPQGSFSNAQVTTDANGEAPTAYTANFMDPNDVDVVITADATLAANPNPTVSGPSLTAMDKLGITGQILNMYLTELGGISDPSNNIIYNTSTGTLAADSDQTPFTNIFIFQIRWDNTSDDDDFVLNNNGSANLNDTLNANTNKSVYLIFEGGTYVELDNSAREGGGSNWARWDVADSNIVSLLDGLQTTSRLLVGLADAGSIGLPEDTGSNTTTLTATPPPPPLVATTLVRISGNSQSGQIGALLSNSLVVEVRDQNGDPLSGVDVGFTVSPNDGMLSSASVTTGSGGRASVALRLGQMVGAYAVMASVAGVGNVIFTATATAIPLVATTLQKVSGDNQSAQVSNALANPLVVRVLDQNGAALSGVDVDFSTTGGTLSDSTVATGTNGQASVTLTLPATPGDYTVTASVSGIATNQTFTATATALPPPPPVATTLEIVSGDGQSAQVGEQLSNPLIVRVLDQNSNPFQGATVTFSTTDGILSTNAETTDANGQAETELTLPSGSGDVTVTASVAGISPDITLTATALPRPIAEIASKILLFKRQLNRITAPAAAGDNDYSTYTSANTVSIAIDKAGVAQAFDTIFLKMMNVVSYVISVDGVDLPARTVPQHLTGVPELGNVPILRHGYQHDLYELPSVQSGSTVAITFTGTNIRISEVWVLKKIAALQKIKNIAHSQIDQDSVPQNNLYGYDEIDTITGLDRLRWQSDIEIEFTHTDENHEVFMDLIEDHAEEGIVAAQEPSRLPWRIYQAIFSKLSHSAPYLSTSRPAGNTLQFVIDEIREATALWYSMDTFNSNDSGDGLMFFKPCVHLFENREVDDNDYKTFSTQTTHTFNVEAVSHIFVKATGVTSYQVQTYVSNAWVTQETITPAQKTYRGYDNSLTQLTTRIVADRVRLVFTGTSIQIYEVMCLDRGGEILTDTQSLLSKTDRTGVIHEGQGGVLKRSRVRQSQRMKWDIGVRATFGHLDDFVVDDVFDWINAYPNFVFSYLPNEFPWRTFPATWTDPQFQQAFLTTILQHGDYLQMNVKER